jgi:peptidyl-prolyl cis-trans isomerase C
MDGIRVGGRLIPEAAIAAETQNHPASSPEAARRAAAEALVIREVLRQEVLRTGIVPQPLTDARGRRETDEDAAVRELIAARVAVPAATPAACRRHYEAHPDRYRSPDLFEARHILYEGPRSDDAAHRAAAARAEAAIALLAQRPQDFGALAAAESGCPSGANGGSLGQTARGELEPELESFLLVLEEGQLCPVPVKTRLGAHVLQLDRRIAGRVLPFEAVEAAIARRLDRAAWRRAAAAYVGRLLADADIDGWPRGGSAPAGEGRTPADGPVNTSEFQVGQGPPYGQW